MATTEETTATGGGYPAPLEGEVTRLADGTMVMDEAQEEAFLARTGALPEAGLDLRAVVWFHDGPESDPSARLRACVRVLGALAILEAYAVEVRGDDGKVAADDGTGPMEFVAAEVDAGTMWEAHGMQGHAETAEIGGRRYAVFMSPGCA